MDFLTDNLHRFQKPSRYIGREVGAVIKDDAQVELHLALAFPDVYEIGMSHVGLRILYGLINQQANFWAERVMAPWPDLQEAMQRSGRRLTSLESGRALADFDLIGFSLQYELSYTNILHILDLGGVPLSAAERGPGSPLVIGGGPGAFNPEPVADFFDFFYLGDAEAGLLEILAEVSEWKKAGGSKTELLHHLSGRPGIYIPSLFQPVHGPDGRLLEIKPLQPGYEKAVRVISPDLDGAYFPDSPVVPYAKPVHDRVAVEIARGCTRGCRFCQAGFIYRPVRERRPETILELTRRALKSTGQDEASFLSLSAGDYSCLPQLMTAFMDEHGPRSVSLSLPSLRVKTLTSRMMEQIKRVHKTGFTLAPEAGTQRLRDVINKDLTEDDLIQAAGRAFHMGWRLIKLYFMIGLPTETKEDLLAIADLAARVRAGSKSRVNVSFAVFIPKSHTPFQWEAMLDMDQMRDRLDLLRDHLKRPGLKPKWNRAEASLLEGVLARGDRRLAPVIRTVARRGAGFDAWTEHLQLDRWLDAMSEAGLSPGEYLRARGIEEVLPWSHLDSGADPEFLWTERQKAYQGRTTGDCRLGDCLGCGVCDLIEIRPRVCQPEKDAPPSRVCPPIQGEVRRFLINYAKTGPARLLSHLETVDVFCRAVRRAGFDFRMSQGFHPQPKISFLTPLPVGTASLDEYAEMELINPPPAETVKEKLSLVMPQGFSLEKIFQTLPEGPRPRASGASFRLESQAGRFDAAALESLKAGGPITVTKPGKKGPRQMDLAPLLGPIKVLTSTSLEITINTGSNGSIRPEAAAQALFGLTKEEVAGIEVVKLKTRLEP